MSGSPLPQKRHEATILFFSDLLEGLEHFIFFGTLLGITRDGAPIKGDDDVDFYVAKDQRNEFIHRLETAGFKLDLSAKPNHTDFFLQVADLINGKFSKADFYFYERQEENIAEYWHFHGPRGSNFTKMIVPNDLVYPLTTVLFRGKEISVPANPEGVCEYLYGSSWIVPKEKGSQYKIKIIDSVPTYIEIKGLNLKKYLKHLKFRHTFSNIEKKAKLLFRRRKHKS